MNSTPRWIAWSWTALLLVVCWIPRGYVPRREALPSRFQIEHLDKWIHAGLFFGYAIAWGRVAGTSRQRRLRLLAGGLLLAPLSELVQAHPWVGRQADLADAAADLAGLAVGGLTSALISSRRPGWASPSAGP